jgi:hypothetical protein
MNDGMYGLLVGLMVGATFAFAVVSLVEGSAVWGLSALGFSTVAVAFAGLCPTEKPATRKESFR